MLWWNTDYLKGNEVLDGSALVDVMWQILGPTHAAPNEALFTQDHVRACMRDGEFNIPTMHMQDKFVNKYDRTCAWWPWTASVGDCDSRTTMFGSDIVQAALKQGWTRGGGFVDLWYVSQTLRKKDAVGLWEGYHSAPAIVHKDPTTNRWKMRVYQPESEKSEPRWNDSTEEVRLWVNATGIV